MAVGYGVLVHLSQIGLMLLAQCKRMMEKFIGTENRVFIDEYLGGIAEIYIQRMLRIRYGSVFGFLRLLI